MVTDMKVFGVLLISIGVLVPVYAFFHQGAFTVPNLMFLGVCVLAGIACILSNRLASLEIRNIGKLTAHAKQDAKEIGEIHKEVEAHRDQIAMMVRDANLAHKQINKTQQLAHEADTATKELREVLDFSTLVLKAQCDDRKAFERLVEIGEQSGPFAELARAAFVDAGLKLTAYETAGVGILAQWELKELDPRTATIEDVYAFHGTCQRALHPLILQEVWARRKGDNKLSDHERMTFVAHELFNGESLAALNLACRLMNQVAKLPRCHPRQMEIGIADQLRVWWNDHKQEIGGTHPSSGS